MSLYNEVRPRLLSEVKGQDAIKAQLAGMFASAKVPNAMLFVGPRGTGKTTIARIVSRYVNCEKGGAEPCEECSSCKAILSGTSLDVVELDAASHNGVSDVHQIIEQAQLAPNGRYKVFILDEVHMFSDSAWNALLKTLEEPPQGVIFILCTTEENKVPATIISRCRRFHFEKIDIPVIVDSMKEICDKYGKAYDEDALMLIARASEGCMRDALSILESFFDVEALCVDAVVEALGTSKEDVIFDILSGISEGNVAKALDALRESDKRGVSLKALVKSLIVAVTDTMYLLQGADVAVIANSDSYKERLAMYKDMADMDACLELTKRLTDCYSLISRADDVEFLVENAIVDSINHESRISVLEKRVAELEKRPAVAVNGQPVAVKASVSDVKRDVPGTKPETDPETEYLTSMYDGEDECPFVDDYQSLFEDDTIPSDEATVSNVTAFVPKSEDDECPFEEDVPSLKVADTPMQPLDLSKLPAGTAIAGTISLSDLSSKVEEKEKMAAGAENNENAGTATMNVGDILPFGLGGFSGLL